MKVLKWILLPAIVVSLLIFAPAMGLSHEKDICDSVCFVALKGRNAHIPPGHYRLIANYADKHLTEAFSMGYRNITLKTMIDNGLNNYFIVDTRQPVAYCQGHLPGAVNIPYQYAADPSYLALLPIDEPIVVICATGQTASQVVAIYNLLGYNAYNLRFGHMSVVEATVINAGGGPVTVYGYGFSPLEQCEP